MSLLGDVLRTKLLLVTFYDLLIRHFKKRKKSCFFSKSEKSEKYVFSNTGDAALCGVTVAAGGCL